MALLTGISSSLLIKPSAGISGLSELEIDLDKDWNGMSISNLKEIAPGMNHGDLGFRGNSAISRLPAGVSGQFLQTRGPGKDPWWRSY